MQTIRVVVTGRVQGVWFRECTRQEANRFGLTGWVRNLRDGSVEAIVQGEQTAIAAMLNWLRQGPPLARVDELVSEPVEQNELDRMDSVEGGSGFSVRYDG